MLHLFPICLTSLGKPHFFNLPCPHFEQPQHNKLQSVNNNNNNNNMNWCGHESALLQSLVIPQIIACTTKPKPAGSQRGTSAAR